MDNVETTPQAPVASSKAPIPAPVPPPPSPNALKTAEQHLAEKVAADPNKPMSVSELLYVFQEMQKLNNRQFQETLKTVLTEIRKPIPDPVREAQKTREKATKEAAEKEYWAKKAAKKKNCSHLRQNGSCVISWAVQSDGTERGHCPYCDSVFTPDDGELYTQMRRLNRGLMESVRFV